MANDGYKKAFDGLLETYVSFGENAETIIRQLKKTPNADARSKLVRELRSLDKKRLELLDQKDNLPKSTYRGAERTTAGQIKVAKSGGQAI